MNIESKKIYSAREIYGNFADELDMKPNNTKDKNDQLSALANKTISFDNMYSKKITTNTPM